MSKDLRELSLAAAAAVSLLLPATALTHGDVQPQPVNTEGLKDLGGKWLAENPYRGNETAVEIGSSAYNQNCARCHGLDVISGGIAPDLRLLEANASDDAWFMSRIRSGAVRNGITYMPAFEKLMSQEAMWAIKSYIDTKDQ